MSTAIKIVIGLLLGFIIVGLIFSFINQVREAAGTIQCQNNLKHLNLTLHNYHDIFGKLPLGLVANDNLPLEKKLGLMFRLFPFVESRMDLAGKFPDQRKAWDAGENLYLARYPFPIPACPLIPCKSEDGYFLATYVGMAGVGNDSAFLPWNDSRIGMFGNTRQLSFEDILDGTQNTVAFAETATDNGVWMAAGPQTLRSLEGKVYIGHNASFSTNHQPGWLSRTPTLNMGFADGSVRSITYSLNPRTFEALVTVAGKEKLPAME